MRKRWKLILLFICAALLAAVGGGLLYVGSEDFQSRAQAYIQERVARATRLDTAIGRLRFNLWRGEFLIHGLALKPRTPESGFLDLEIREVRGRFRIRALWKLAVDLEELSIFHPVIILRAGLPPTETRRLTVGQAIEATLKVAARKVWLHDGVFTLHHRRHNVDLYLEDLECELSHQRDPMAYKVNVSYRNGVVDYAGRHITYDLSTRLTLFSSGLDIESFTARRPHSTFSGSGTLQGYDPLRLSLDATGRIGSQDFTLATEGLREARGSVDVIIAIQWGPEGFSAAGRFSAAASGYRQAAFRDLAGAFEIREKVLHLRDVRGRIGPGRFRLEGALQLSSETSASHQVSVNAGGVPLAEAARIFEVPRLGMSNTADAQARLRWRRGLEDLELEVLAKLSAADNGAGGPADSTPLGGQVAFGYRRGAWLIHQVLLDSESSRVEIRESGPYRAQLQLETGRPEEIIRLARRVVPALEDQLQEYPDLQDISGRFRLSGELLLEFPDRFGYTGWLEAQDGRWRRLEADTLETDIRWEGLVLQLSSLKAQRGVQSLRGNLEARFSAVEGGMPELRANGDFSRISLDLVRQWGEAIPADMEGTISGAGAMVLKSGHWSGEGTFRVQDGSFKGTGFDLLSGEFHLEDRQLRIARGKLTRGVASAEAEGTVAVDTQAMNFSGRLTSFPLREIPQLKDSGLDLDGILHAAVTVRGTPQNPEVRADVELDKFRYGSWDLGRGKGTVQLAGELLSLEMGVTSQLGRLHARAKISTTAGYAGRVELELQDWNLERTVQDSIPPYLQELSTALQGRIEVEGDFAEPRALRAVGDLEGVRLKVRDYELRNKGKIRFSVAEARLRLDEAQIEGEGSNLRLSGEAPLDRTLPMDVHLQGSLNIRSLPRLAQDVTVTGTTDVDVRIGGTFAAPQIIGQASLQDFRLAHDNLPFALSSAQGKLVFSQNSVVIENLRGTLAAGSADISGSLGIVEGELRAVSLQMAVRGARLPYPEGFRSTINADLTLRGDQNTQALAGKVSVLRSDYLADFDLLGQVGGSVGTPAPPQAASSLLSAMSLNISIVSQDSLYIDNALARVRGRVNLMLRGTLAYPLVTGRAEAVDGTIFFRNTRFEILRAAADFVERKPLNPVLDIRAEADVKKYRLQLDVSGDMNSPRLNLTSDPPLPTVEIVLLLTTGIAREESGDVDKDRYMSAGATSLLSAGLTGMIDRRVGRLFGLESFRVEPYWVSSEKDPTARVTISERLSKDLTVTYSRNLSTSEEQVVVIEYDVTRNLTMVATQNEKGEFGVDFRLRKRFR